MPSEFKKKHLQQLLEAMPDAILITNREGNIDFVNKQFEAMFGYSKDELVKQSIEILLPERFSEIHKVYRSEFINSPKTRQMGWGANYNLIGKRRNGIEFPVEISLSPIDIDEHGFVIAAVRDITQRMQIEEKLREKEKQLQTLNDNLPKGYTYQIDFGIHGELRQMIYISAGVENLLGISAKQVLEDPTKLSEFFLKEDNIKVAEIESLALASLTTFTAESRFKREGGQIGWMLLTSTPRKLANNHIVWDGIALDITERKHTEDELQSLARMDTLTGLFNRHHFFEIAQKEFAESIRYQRFLSLIILDLDKFKDINDSYGHMVGDQMLIHIGNLLHNIIRESDTVARYGGEEFIVLLPETDRTSAQVFAERLRKLVAESPVQNGKDIIRVTASIGIADKISNQKVDTLDNLVSQADQALYEAKRTGRNKVVCYLKNNS